MRNLTLAIDETTLHRARKLALDQNTTVNRLVREFLADYVHRGDGRERARQRLKERMAQGRLSVGEKTWTRADLYER